MERRVTVMEIRNYLTRQASFASEQTVLLKTGETYEATIKEKMNANEAIVNIKGTDIRVQVEGEFPEEGRVMIEVKAQQGDVPVVKMIPRLQSKKPQTNDITTILTKLGAGENVASELKQAGQLLLSNGMPLTKETVAVLKTFFSEAPGTAEQKLDTIRALVNKKLEVTNAQITAVHEALHGKSLSEILTSIAKQLDANFAFTKQETGNKQRVTKDVLLTQAENEIAASSSSAAAEVQTDHEAEQTVQVLRKAKDIIRHTNHLPEAIQRLKNEIVSHVNEKTEAEIERLIERVSIAQKIGKDRLIQAFAQVEKELVSQQAEVGQALRANEVKPQPPENLAELVKSVRNEVMKEADLTKALAHVRTQLVDNENVPIEIKQKIDKAVKDALMLQQIGRETFAKNHLIRTLEQAENAAAAKGQKPLEAIQQVKHTIAKAETIEAAIREIRQQLHRFTDKNIAAQLTKAMVEAVKLDKSSREQLLTSLTNLESGQTKNVAMDETAMSSQRMRDAIRNAIKTLQREANFEKAFEFIKTETMPLLNKETELGQKLADSFAKALQLEESGRELAARQTMLQTLKEIETSLPMTANEETVPSASLDNLFDSEWQSSLQLQTKDIIVQTITKKMSQAAIDFKNIKRDIMRNLEAVSQLIEKYKQSVQPQVKQLLETAIKQLDNAILKSDMMLFTDMTTEKQLMKASSQLAEAKKRLNKGDYSGAQKIVKEVKDVLEKMQFKPSDVKVKHFVANESLKFADSSNEFLTNMNKVVQPSAFEPSARQMFEMIRRLGFTHDYEVADSLVFKGNNEEVPQQNMKAILLKLAQSGNEHISQQAEQALNNLTGQQLLNKFDPAANMQSLFFTLPMLLQNEVKNVKVYVNSRKDGERIDWENCSLYFLLETKKLGDIGILLNANDRNLSVTFRNDKTDFAQKVQPLMDAAKERLEEIGYRLTGINVTKLTNEKAQANTLTEASAKSYATFTEKGYDFTI